MTTPSSSTDYENIVAHCLKVGELWEDPEFPANQTSVFYYQNPPFVFQWKRPHEIVHNPTFVSDDFEIDNGKLGDKWFAACLGCLRTSEGLLYRVVPADQGFSERHDYAGVFRCLSRGSPLLRSGFSSNYLMDGQILASEEEVYFGPIVLVDVINRQSKKIFVKNPLWSKFRIWWNGEWKEVLVDDRLPTVNGKLVFIHAEHCSPFWPALLEKAYAKLHGSYEALKYGTVLDGLSDLTGGIAECVAMEGLASSGHSSSSSSSSCFVLLSNLLKMTTIVTCKAVVALGEHEKDLPAANAANGHPQPTAIPQRLPNGIMSEESYRIYQIQKVENVHGDRMHFLRLRITSGRWRQQESQQQDDGCMMIDTSDDWRSLATMTRDKLTAMIPQREGEFWMSFKDWSRTFTHLEAIHLDIDTARDEPSLAGKNPWILRLYHGRWQKGVSAGGCRNNTETFHINPRLSLSLPEADDVVMALNQHTAMDPKVIGFTGYPLPGQGLLDGHESPPPLPSNNSNSNNNNNRGGEVTEARIGKSYFRSRKSLLNSQYTNSKQVSLRVRLEAGQVLVLPTTFEPGEEAAFTFRVFSRSPALKMKVVDVVPAVVGNVFARSATHGFQMASISTANPRLVGGGLAQQNGGSGAAATNGGGPVAVLVAKDFSQYEPIFLQMSEDKRTVSAFELQDLLEACLPNDYIKSCASLEVCRQVVVAFDSTGVGRITFANFKDLMCSLKLWHNVFKNWTKEKSGILKADRLKDALLEVGFQLNSTIMSTIMYRYIRKDGTLRFGDFVAIILNLGIAFDAFEKRDALQQGSVRVGKTEWIKLAMTC